MTFKRMNKLNFLLVAIVALFAFSCIENDEIIYEKSVVEFDAATWNAKSVVDGVAKNYTLLTRRPNYGQFVSTSNPVITRASGTITLRVNLVGPHRPEQTEVAYKIVAEETTAVAGTHYSPLAGKVTIPANSSFGEVSIPILNPGVSSTTAVRLVLELVGNENLPANENYKRIGISINQQ
ncbi:DUF4843 domain-containing protein [Rufibacter quisquiliarum]|uniref:DUF4843 domain-containing protein n=2 Tax=Rufibacter quisquiliarum TaxID=1549639 RepID=A0A839GDY3_9BACT|nr:hypothetical protein [Rufibacter quisquiliarum]